VAQVKPPSPTPPPYTAGCIALSDGNYEAAVITNIHIQATAMQNIYSLISVSLVLSSMHYARWRNNVLLTLGRYSLSNHVLLDTTYIGVPACE
jgi:hypothetical protein